MEPIKSLEGKRVALLGLGISQIDFCIGLENGKEWDEVWGINSVVRAFDCDRMFMMDPASRFFDSEDAGKQTSVLRKILPELKIPIYTCELDERVPAAVEYPLQEVCDYAKCSYFNNTVAYALGFAYYNKLDAIDLFGIDFSYKHNMHFAESGRACVEFWLSKCMSAGIIIGASPKSTLLDSNVPPAERLYGYHRLEDPLVALPDNEGQWVICPASKLEEMIQKHNMSFEKPLSAPEPYKG